MTPSPPLAAPARPLARLAVTIAVPALVLLARRVPLPGVDWSGAGLGGVLATSAAATSILALGLGPFVSSFVLVELAAAAWPGWRPLRVGGPAARARLEHSALWLGVALAVLQGWGLAVYLNRIGALPDTGADRAVLVLTLAAASVALVWLASVVSRWGLGSGFAVLLAADTLAAVPAAFRQAARPLASGGDVGFPGLAMELILPLVAVGIVLNLLLGNGRRERQGFDGLRLRDPASGLFPLAIASSALLMPATLTGWFPALDEVARSARPGTVLHEGILLVVAVALAVWLSGVFNGEERVAAVWGRLDGAPPDPAARVARAKDALRTARVRSAVLVAALVVLRALLGLAGPGLSGGATGLVALAFAAAAVADVVAEWRARGAEPTLVPVWPEHRLYAVDPAVEALAAAGIAATLRGVHYRTLGQLFTPYVPVEILVPASDAPAADRVLRRVLAGASGDAAPSATVA